MKSASLFIPFFFFFFLGACSDDDNSGHSTGAPSNVSSAAAPPDTLIGVVSRNDDGSVTVNGYQMPLSDVWLHYHGAPVSGTLLVSGMPVTVSSRSGVVQSIEIDPDL
ncbi:MAG: hypothetical protein KDJ38_07425, partial [Gammaproteobacteria bacterium]|nr:hypothetical protein [Gammaproteobacteria bacterium]